jgi:hypothetical protein
MPRYTPAVPEKCASVVSVPVELSLKTVPSEFVPPACVAENARSAHFVDRAKVTCTAIERRAVEESINTRSQTGARIPALRWA